MKGTRFDITERVAIVTGGSKGLGYQMALDLADAGADVAIVSRNLEEGEKAAEDVRKKGRNALAIRADVSQVEECKMMVKKTMEDFGKLDILVNNAGIVHRGPLFEVTESIYDNLFDIDLKGLFFCSQFAAEEMKKQKKGRIINITSVSATVPGPMFGIYSTAKAAAAQLTRACALEWAQYGITVNAIGPYSTPTTQNKEFLAIKSNYEALAGKTALKRIGAPEDLTGTLLLLASDASSFITGQSFYVCGGVTAGMVMEVTPEGS